MTRSQVRVTAEVHPFAVIYIVSGTAVIYASGLLHAAGTLELLSYCKNTNQLVKIVYTKKGLTVKKNVKKSQSLGFYVATLTVRSLASIAFCKLAG